MECWTLPVALVVMAWYDAPNTKGIHVYLRL
jgi:hypothetical protein